MCVRDRCTVDLVERTAAKPGYLVPVWSVRLPWSLPLGLAVEITCCCSVVAVAVVVGRCWAAACLQAMSKHRG